MWNWILPLKEIFRSCGKHYWRGGGGETQPRDQGKKRTVAEENSIEPGEKLTENLKQSMTIYWPRRERAAEQQNYNSVERKRVKTKSEACADQERYRIFYELLTKGQSSNLSEVALLCISKC
jgi:hypothetical protein